MGCLTGVESGAIQICSCCPSNACNRTGYTTVFNLGAREAPRTVQFGGFLLWLLSFLLLVLGAWTLIEPESLADAVLNTHTFEIVFIAAGGLGLLVAAGGGFLAGRG